MLARIIIFIIIIILFKTEAASNYTEHIRRTGNSCHFPTFCCSHISKHSGWRPVHEQNVCGGLSMTCTMVAFKPRLFHIQLVFSNKHNKMELICSLWLKEVKLAISCKLFVMIRWLTVMNWRKSVAVYLHSVSSQNLTDVKFLDSLSYLNTTRIQSVVHWLSCKETQAHRSRLTQTDRNGLCKLESNYMTTRVGPQLFEDRLPPITL